MSLYLLDTNICIHFLKGQYSLAEKIKNVGPLSCYISEITIAELLFGVANSSESQREKNRKNAQEFLNSFSGRTLLMGDCFYEYARQKSNLRRIGRTVGEFDLLIGSTAIVNDLILVTRNTRDFINLNGIMLENWIDS
ncbi:type II toxin-antitoxin system VapC family toxin [Dyadobacter sp. CY356]|uniref:type II toxin-antitoxin system VapC family toxin n=1 Tax=Dyadobacter sp. CY356 TaxID=2906442 RepID=UPI001F216056|nr:type II toxin-antitoxin system VapC family toxin [Dyadobacter sp. CY356]MCF0058275.1 type II toxin-antitoxin system VapC family toxin [Dyadobacter sp. CY356]